MTSRPPIAPLPFPHCFPRKDQLESQRILPRWHQLFPRPNWIPGKGGLEWALRWVPLQPTFRVQPLILPRAGHISSSWLTAQLLPQKLPSAEWSCLTKAHILSLGTTWGPNEGFQPQSSWWDQVGFWSQLNHKLRPPSIQPCFLHPVRILFPIHLSQQPSCILTSTSESASPETQLNVPGGCLVLG